MTLPTMRSEVCSREFLRVAGGYDAVAQGDSPAGGLDVDNAGNLATNGDTTLGGTLNVAGAAALAGGLSVSGAASFGGKATVEGAVRGDGLDVRELTPGVRWIDTNSGAADFRIGVSANTMAFSVDTDGDDAVDASNHFDDAKPLEITTAGIQPGAGGSYQLGTSSRPWTSGYASAFDVTGTFNAGFVEVGKNNLAQGRLYLYGPGSGDEGGEIQLYGASGYAKQTIDTRYNTLRIFSNSPSNTSFDVFNVGSGVINMSLDGTLTVYGGLVADGGLFSGDLTPDADSLYDIGSSSIRWANLYADAISCGVLAAEDASETPLAVKRATSTVSSLVALPLQMRNNASAYATYGLMQSKILDSTSGAHYGQLDLQCAVAGSLATRLHLNSAGLKLYANTELAGILNFTGTMENSSLDPTVDNPADWIEVKINGVTRYLPAYAAA